MGMINTLFLITVATTRMIFPGLPAIPSMPEDDKPVSIKAAARTINFELSSTNKANNQSKADVSLPDGLKAGNSAKLNIELKQPAKDDSKQDKPAESSKVTLKTYWGCGETVLDGQPKISELTDNAGKADVKDANSPIIDIPDGSYAFWPDDNSEPLGSDASSFGIYNLTTNYCGNTSVTLDADQGFLAPIQAVGLRSKNNFEKSITITWRTVPNAKAYLLTAIGGNLKETITWTSSAKAGQPFGIEYKPISSDEMEKFIKEKILLPANATTCVIPAGIFKGSNSVMLLITAIGKDKTQESNGITTNVLVRSTASIPLMSKATYLPPSLETPE